MKSRPVRNRWLTGPLGLALVIGGAAVTACHTRAPEPGRDAATAGAHEIVIAVPWPWQRRAQIRYGEGLDLAVDQVNAAGGIVGRQLRLERYDDKESVDEGRLVAERIARTPGIVAVIGHLQSYVTLPAAAIYDRVGLPLLAPASTDPALTSNGYARVFRVTVSVSAIGHHMAEVAAHRGYRRVVIEYVRTDYGRDLSNAFEARATELGIVVPVRKSYEPSDSMNPRAFESTFREWTQLEPDALFLAGEPPSAIHVLEMARRAGITLPVLAGDALSSPELLAAAGPAVEGAIVAAFFHPDEPRSEVTAFTHAFQQKFGVPPDAGSALGYDAVNLLAEAIRVAASAEPERISAALRQIRQWHGVTGAFTFDEHGETVGKRVLHVKVRNGRFAFMPEETPTRTSGGGGS